MRFQKGNSHITSGQILVSSWEEAHRRMEASIKVNISDVLCSKQLYIQMEHQVLSLLPLYIVSWSHAPKLLLICRDQEEFSFFCITWLLALFFPLCTCFSNSKGWLQLEWRTGFGRTRYSFRFSWESAETLGWIALFLFAKFWTWQTKKEFFAVRSESVCSFQHGAGLAIINLPVFQFLVLSSGLLLPQEAQMLVALECLLGTFKGLWVFVPCCSLSFLMGYAMLCAVQRYLYCLSFTDCWFQETAPDNPVCLCLCSTSTYFDLIIWKCRFFQTLFSLHAFKNHVHIELTGPWSHKMTLRK